MFTQHRKLLILYGALEGSNLIETPRPHISKGEISPVLETKPKRMNLESKHHTLFFVKTVLFLIFLNERFFTVSKVNLKKKTKQANIHLAIIDIV